MYRGGHRGGHRGSHIRGMDRNHSTGSQNSAKTRGEYDSDLNISTRYRPVKVNDVPDPAVVVDALGVGLEGLLSHDNYLNPKPGSTESKYLAEMWQKEQKILPRLARAWRSKGLSPKNETEKLQFHKDKTERAAVLRTWKDNPTGANALGLETIIFNQLLKEYGHSRLRPLTQAEILAERKEAHLEKQMKKKAAALEGKRKTPFQRARYCGP